MASARKRLPSGRVTFAFTDVVGSTRTFIEHGEVYAEALRALHVRIAEHTAGGNGVVVETEGDGAFLAFPDASSAVTSLLALQDELESTVGQPGLRLRIRSGAHSGDAVPVSGHYLALAVYVAARVAGTSGAGQLFVTDEVIGDLREAGMPAAEGAADLGSYRLKDIADPVRLWRMTGDPTPPRAKPARPTNVRVSRTSYVGREHELGRLAELVTEPGLVTCVGPGGVGKTRLVSEFALSHAGLVPGGVWLVELASITAADELLPVTASALGLAINDIGDVTAEIMRRGQLVLVLDNCEHLLDPVVDLVETLLAASEDLTIVATSRETLRMAEERVLNVAPLDTPTAARLFHDRAVAASGRELAPDGIDDLCAALDRLPLAIELAASQADATSVGELLETVRSGGDPLARRGGAQRQRNLDEILAWSLDRLGSRLRDSLLALSVFPGHFTPAMAQALLAAVPDADSDAVMSLARASLIDLDDDDYRMLSTIRAAAQRMLAENPALQARALDALTGWAVALGVDVFHPSQFYDHVPDDTALAVQAGVAHGLETGVKGLGKALDVLSTIAHARGVTASLLDIASRALAITPVDADGVLLQVAASGILTWWDEHSTSLTADQAATMVEVARATGDPDVLNRALNAAGISATESGDWETARARLFERLRLNESQPDQLNLPAALITLANHFFLCDEPARAVPYAERAVALAHGEPNWVAEALARTCLSEELLAVGRPEEARVHALAALEASPPTWRLRSWAMSRLTLALAALGEREEALQIGRDVLPELRARAEHDTAGHAELLELLTAVPELVGHQ